MQCKFKVTESNSKFLYECEYCGRTLTLNNRKNVSANCSAAPTTTQRLINFGNAVVRHVADGMKKASAPQVEQRLKICQSCPLFRATTEDGSRGYCSHANCGCNIDARPDVFLNKIAWASEKCPEGKWDATEPQTPPDQPT